MKYIYQISTLQALMQGYFKEVVTTEKLLQYGDTGLGTFTDVNGEMIALDGHVYRADSMGNVTEAAPDQGVPFAAVAFMEEAVECEIEAGNTADALKAELNRLIDSDFGLNSIYAVRLDGHFKSVKARSELGQHSQHIELSEVLKKNQTDFEFDDIDGTVVCLYFPDYMHGINAAGWHLHFVSADRTKGGHVYEVDYDKLICRRSQLHGIRIQLPTDKAYDTYDLNSVTQDQVKKVEQ